MLRRVRFGLLMSLVTSSAAWASPPPLWLVKSELALDGFAVVLGVATLGLIGGEISAMRKEREVARLALAVEQQRLEMAEQRAAAEEASARSAPALNPLMAGRAPKSESAPRPTSAPPPPPPAMAAAPPPPPAMPAAPPPPAPAAFMPPPPPPLPAAAASSGDANPFARLAALGAESEESVKKASKANPISLPTAPPEAPPPTESGGWADLMQKVRSAKDSEGPVFSPPPPPAARPAADAPKAGGADAWEALLKKTSAAAAGDNPFAAGDLGRSAPPPEPGPLKDLLSNSSAPASANPFASLGGATSGGALQPPPPAPEAPQEPLPDFIRKASRTISLDSFKSGEGKL